MKILCLIDSLGSGGAQRQMITLAEMLKKLNYNVSFIIYHRDDFFKEKLDNLNIPINYFLVPNPVLRIWRIRKFIRSSGCNVVISFLETPNFINCLSAIGGKSWKVITSERSAKESTFLSLRGKIFSRFQRFSDVLVCNSHISKKMWEKYYPSYSDKLVVIYNPVILSKITSEYTPKLEGKLHIVVAASYQYLKNPIGLIKALTLISKDDSKNIKVNWYGRIDVTIGDSRAYDETVRLIKKHQLEGIVCLNKQTKDIVNRMNEADVIALFSELEGLPNVICEGMMIGKPIIMTRVSDYNTLVDEKNGFLCDWDNPESIKKVLLDAAELSVEKLNCMGKVSKNKALSLFSSDLNVKDWEKLIKG